MPRTHGKGGAAITVSVFQPLLWVASLVWKLWSVTGLVTVPRAAVPEQKGHGMAQLGEPPPPSVAKSVPCSAFSLTTTDILTNGKS